MLNNYLFSGIIPKIPSTAGLRPPLLYDLMNSIVNFDKETETSIHNLAKESREKIFDFTYPLSEKVDKEEFETMILNKFINRRIGFETFTLFQIKLNVKMNEIMPRYNKLFEAMADWNIFKDGEKFTKDSTDNRTTESSNSLSSESSSESTSDRRNSELPQNEIEDVANGTYLTDYQLDNNTASDTSMSTGSSDSTDNNIYHETSSKDVSDKIRIYNEFIENKNNIMTMIFKDLDSLFYQLV